MTNAQDRYSMSNINTLFIDDSYSDRLQYSQINSEIKTILISNTYTKSYLKLPGYQLNFKKIIVVYKGDLTITILIGLDESFTINQDQNFTIYYFAQAGLDIKHTIFYDPDSLPITNNLHGEWEITFSNPNNNIIFTPSISSNINLIENGSVKVDAGYASIRYRIAKGQSLISSTAKWLFTLSLFSPKPVSGVPDLPIPFQSLTDPSQNTGFIVGGTTFIEEENFCANMQGSPNVLVNNTGNNAGYSCVITFVSEPNDSFINIVWKKPDTSPTYMNYNYRVVMILTRIQ